MINLDFSEFEMQYGNGVAESLDAAGIDGSIHAGSDSAGAAGKPRIAGVGGAVRNSPPEALP